MVPKPQPGKSPTDANASLRDGAVAAIARAVAMLNPHDPLNGLGLCKPGWSSLNNLLGIAASLEAVPSFHTYGHRLRQVVQEFDGACSPMGVINIGLSPGLDDERRRADAAKDARSQLRAIEDRLASIQMPPSTHRAAAEEWITSSDAKDWYGLLPDRLRKQADRGKLTKGPARGRLATYRLAELRAMYPTETGD